MKRESGDSLNNLILKIKIILQHKMLEQHSKEEENPYLL